jgi:hypothetical protein
MTSQQDGKMKWLHIDTAPKDGTPILATDMYEIKIANFAHHNYFNGKPVGPKSWGRGGYQCPDFDPKYWMEIPPLNNSSWSNQK